MPYPGTIVYDKEETLSIALKAIKDGQMTMITEVTALLPCSRATLYMPEWSDVMTAIQSALQDERVKRKAKYRKQWANEFAPPPLQLAGYRLIADEDELERLTVTNNNTKHSGELAITWDEKRSYSDALIEGSTIIQVQDSTQQQLNDTDTTNTAG